MSPKKFDHMSVQSRLLELSRQTGYNFVQNNGQRVYTPPPNLHLELPPKGSEVFIGKLPRNVFEDELIPLFSTIGPLYNFRLMMDFSGKNRGFAFACYTNEKDAITAVKNLDNYEIRPRVQMGVYKSVDNCRLFIGNIPNYVSGEDLQVALSHYVDNIVNVIIYPDVADEKLNRGYAFVEFANHSSAAMARRQLAQASLELFEKPAHVDWADPIPEVDPEIMAQVSILYFRNIPVNYTKEQFTAVVQGLTGRGLIAKVHKNNNYAFVHFTGRSTAQLAYNMLQDLVIEDRKVEVTWARPRNFSKANRLMETPTNFCTSVPPKLRRAMVIMKNSTSTQSTKSSPSSSTDGSLTIPEAASTPVPRTCLDYTLTRPTNFSGMAIVQPHNQPLKCPSVPNGSNNAVDFYWDQPFRQLGQLSQPGQPNQHIGNGFIAQMNNVSIGSGMTTTPPANYIMSSRGTNGFDSNIYNNGHDMYLPSF